LVGWLSLAQLITWGSVFYTFALLMEPVERELGLTRAQSSLAFSLALLAEGLLAYPVGRWIDRGHERAVMTGGSLVVALCLARTASSPASPSSMRCGWCWVRRWRARCTARCLRWSRAATRNDFRRAIITLTFLGGLASTVFIPLSAWLIHGMGWRHALWVLAAIHLLVCVPVHWRCYAVRRAPGGLSAVVAAPTATRGTVAQPGPVPCAARRSC
jgi:MFS family permease